MKRVPLTLAALALSVLAPGPLERSPGSGSALASDAPLQHALKEAGCMAPSLRQVWQRGDLTVYEANCFATSHRVLTLACDKRGCRVDDPEPDEEGP